MTYLDYDSQISHPSSLDLGSSFQELRQRNDKCRATVFFDKSKDFVTETKMESVQEERRIKKNNNLLLPLPGKGQLILIEHTDKTKQFAKESRMDLLDEVLTYGSFSPSC